VWKRGERNPEHVDDDDFNNPTTLQSREESSVANGKNIWGESKSNI
jgi:hypothetical protein